MCVFYGDHAPKIIAYYYYTISALTRVSSSSRHSPAKRPFTKEQQQQRPPSRMQHQLQPRWSLTLILSKFRHIFQDDDLRNSNAQHHFGTHTDLCLRCSSRRCRIHGGRGELFSSRINNSHRAHTPSTSDRYLLLRSLLLMRELNKFFSAHAFGNRK